MGRLLKYAFQESDLSLPEIQDFYCGAERWDREVAEWIKSSEGENSVLVDMQRYGTKVWLYRTEKRDLVGYGSFGEKTCTWPAKSKQKELVGYVPFVGVQEDFKGQPEEADRDDQFAYQIIDDLIAHAATQTHLFPVVMASVDRENRRSLIFLCKYRNFVDTQTPRTDPRGVIYDRVALVIEDLVVDPQQGWPARQWVPLLASDSGRKEEAIEALRQFNKGAVPALVRALAESDQSIYDEALSLLQEIAPETARRHRPRR